MTKIRNNNLALEKSMLGRKITKINCVSISRKIKNNLFIKQRKSSTKFFLLYNSNKPKESSLTKF